MKRLIYSPEVQVYIWPSTMIDGKQAKPIDISNDIIEGSISRKSNDISTARFVVQNRRLSPNAADKEYENENVSSPRLMLNRIRPMDRIVVYLKKTKPILVFSGYLDLVPMIQFVPEPVVIEASCTLKRLQFTYWDPTLPNVLQALQKMGMAVNRSDNGFNVFQVPGADSFKNEIQDTGFPKLLSFLLHDVGGWPKDNIWIEPIPQSWLKQAQVIFNDLIESDKTFEAVRSFMSAWLGPTTGTDGGGSTDGTDYVGSGINPPINEADVKNKLKGLGAPDFFIDLVPLFIKYGKKYDVDPIFLIAICGAESTFGKYGPAARAKNLAGLHGGPDHTYPSYDKMLDEMAGYTFISAYKKRKAYTISQIGAIYAPPGASNDAGGNSGWPALVSKFYQQLGGGDPTVAMQGPAYIKRIKAAGGVVDDPSNPSRGTNSPVGNRGINLSSSQLTVYLEAFDAPTPTLGTGPPSPNETNLRQPGYQFRDIFGRNLYDANAQRVDAVNRNIRLVQKIYDKILYINTKQIEIASRTNGSNVGANIPPPIVVIAGKDNSRLKDSEGWPGDLYLTIDHTNAYSDDTRPVFAQPSAATNKSYKDGLPNPTKEYKDSGTGWIAPGKNYGRAKITGDRGLIQNSTEFYKILNSDKVKNESTITESDAKQIVNYSQEQKAYNVPGFYYSNSSAAGYLRFPRRDDNAEDIENFEDAWATRIAYAIYDYAVKMKINKKQAKITTGNKSGSENCTPGTIDQDFDTTKGSGLDIGGVFIPYGPPGESRGTGAKYIVRGGVNNDWDGTMQRALAVLAEVNKNGYPANTGSHWLSQKRKWSSAGGNSDHMTANTSSYAIDMGMPNESTGDKYYKIIMKFLGLPNKARGSYDRYTLDGYAYQVLWYSDDGHKDHIHLGVRKIGASTGATPSFGSDCSGGSFTADGGGGGGLNAENFLKAAFNVSFNFPGSMVDSILLKGQRALENDVPLLDSVKEMVRASMRNFSSLPNGDFIAWYPDYFNVSRKSAWLRISPIELKSCTIDLSDKALTTHVYVLGNPFGIGGITGNVSEWWEKLYGTGIVTIEQPWILDSFLGTNFEKYLDSVDGTEKKKIRSIIEPEEQGNHTSDKPPALQFLEKYGARPYVEQNLTIRHPIMEFFYAYHTFIQKWAEQFVSRAEFTFMPELFPGMIIEIDNPRGINITFYVQDVNHNFSFESGFTTTANLIAPGIARESQNKTTMTYGMIPVNLPEGVSPAKNITVKNVRKPKIKYTEWLKKKKLKSNKKNAAQWRKEAF